MNTEKRPLTKETGPKHYRIKLKRVEVRQKERRYSEIKRENNSGKKNMIINLIELRQFSNIPL